MKFEPQKKRKKGTGCAAGTVGHQAYNEAIRFVAAEPRVILAKKKRFGTILINSISLNLRIRGGENTIRP